ncbi:hypothetical protein [Spirosoma fluminis]
MLYIVRFYHLDGQSTITPLIPDVHQHEPPDFKRGTKLLIGDDEIEGDRKLYRVVEPPLLIVVDHPADPEGNNEATLVVTYVMLDNGAPDEWVEVAVLRATS